MWEDFLAALELGRTASGGYQDGRVVDLRNAPDRVLYLVGDIHAKFSRIRDVVEHAGLQKALSERAVLVFLGDLFHREEDGRAGEMESSIATLQEVMRLKIRFPRSVYMLLGNHEFTRTESTKRGYFQGELFRQRLSALGFADGYDRFVQASPLVVIHSRVVGVHAGPALSVSTLEQLKRVELRDVAPTDLEPAVRELCFARHVDWSPNPNKSYNDYQVEDFLHLCGVPGARLITGHTPLGRDTDWNWDIGRHLTVIFAAGRELGYLRVDSEGEDLVRVGRSEPDNDERLVLDRGHLALAELNTELHRGRRIARLEALSQPLELHPDVCYRFDYPGHAVPLSVPRAGQLKICHYRHLSAASQAYYEQGYYLVGDEYRQEVLRLKRDLAVLLGGSSLVEGVRFRWGEKELAVLRQHDDGVFELRPLGQGLRLGGQGV